MSTVLEQRSLPAARSRRAPWLVAAAALLVLYVPTWIGLARTLWREEEYAHGPIILAVFIWLAINGVRDNFSFLRERASKNEKLSLTPFVVLVPGLLLYVVGRSQHLPLFETASMIPVIAGVVMLVGGAGALRRFAFPLLLLFFLIPLPGFILEAATGPLKEFVSAAVGAVLAMLGYAVERQGVTLIVGGHEMLVADACSGMNSIVSLTALTLLYAHLTRPSSRVRWAVLLASILPIAIAANVLRVIVLALVAYHFGDEAAQGAVHTLAGMLVFVAAFAMLIGVDRLARKRDGVAARPTVASKAQTPSGAGVRRGDLRAALFAALLIVAAAVAAPLLKPVHAEGPALALESAVPQAFGDWSIDAAIEPVAPTPDVQAKLARIYDQTVSRTYVNSAGEQMMLTVAYGGDQSDALKAHRQEVCYSAQGFTIESLAPGDLALPRGGAIPVTRMFAVRGDRPEPVTYWFTMGDRVVRGRVERLAMQLREGLVARRIPDGMLVRVSSISPDPQGAYAAQQAFVAALLAAMPSDERVRLAGAGAR